MSEREGWDASFVPAQPRIIHVNELEQYESIFAKAKAHLIILGEADGSGIPVAERQEHVRDEHLMIDYRLVPIETLRNAVFTIKSLSKQYNELMERAAPLIVAASEQDDGNPFAEARRLYQAARAESPHLPPLGARQAWVNDETEE